MRLTRFSDYAFRLLMYSAAQDRLITIEEASIAFGISRTHLTKVANVLTRTGYFRAVRGRSGGLVLGRRPGDICLGAVVRDTEVDFDVVECFSPENSCTITPCCRLKGVIREALDAFCSTLDRYTLADLMLRPQDFGVSSAP